MFTRNNKILNLCLALILILAITAKAEALRDVPSGHWAKGAVDEVVEDYGLMAGDPNGNFGGNRGLTRYEFAKTLSRMIEYFNSEIDSDRKDLENVVSVMELFQNELKTIEVKMMNVQAEVAAQNAAVNEINELAISLGDGYASLAAGEEGVNSPEVMNARIAQLEGSIDKLQHKGLFIDTLVKGTVNDVKKLGGATGRVFSNARQNLSRRRAEKQLESAQQAVETELIETVNEEVTKVESNTDVENYYDYNNSDLEVLQEVVE